MRVSLPALIAAAGAALVVNPAAAQPPSQNPGVTMGRPPVIYRGEPDEPTGPHTRSLKVPDGQGESWKMKNRNEETFGKRQ